MKRLFLPVFVLLALLGLGAATLGAGSPAQPFTWNGTSVGNSPNLAFTCDAGYAYGVVDGGGFGCLTAGGGGGGVEAGADGQIYQSSGGQGVWNTMTGQCSMTPAGVISCDGGVANILPGTASQLVDTNAAGTAVEWFTPGGSSDVSYSASGHVFTVQGLQGNAVASGAPTLHYVLEWNGSAWAATALPDSNGSAPGLVQLTTDLGGTYNSPEVVGLDGHPIPSFGSGILQSNGTNWSLATVPVAQFSPGTSAQVLMSNATPASTWTTLSGDAVISATGGVTVDGLQGNAVSNTNPSAAHPILIWNGSAYVPSVLSGDLAQGTYSGTAQPYTVTQAQAGSITFGTQGQHSCASGDTTCEIVQASTSSSTGSSLLIQPQQSTQGTNETGGNVNINLQAELGGGSEAYLTLQRSGSQHIQMGAFPGGNYDAIWFLGNNSTTNYAFLGNASTTYLNGTATIYLEINGTPYVTIYPGYTNLTDNVQIGAAYTAAQDCGGGVGLACIAPVTTAPTAAPATNDVLAYLPVGLASVSPAATSTNLAGYGIAPVWSGTINTQTTLPHEVHGGYASTASGSTPVVVYTLSLGSAHAVGMNIHCTGRMTANCASGCSTGDMERCDATDGWTNVGGTLTEVGSPTNTCLHSGGASMTGITTTASGSTISVKVTSGITATADWSCYSEEIFD
jgi:hypothetical protein